jgi:signal transduction histidine kinase
LNLLINAVESTPPGGRIMIHLGVETDQAYVTVTNEGPPIPADVLPHIFEPFYTTKADGVGLGLWISHSLVEQHAGSLVVKNLDDPCGVSFTLKIPLISPPDNQSGLGFNKMAVLKSRA